MKSLTQQESGDGNAVEGLTQQESGHGTVGLQWATKALVWASCGHHTCAGVSLVVLM